MMNWEIRTASSEQTEKIGELLGGLIQTSETIELRSDLGGGKTTFTKGLVRGIGSNDRVASPTFTLNKVYKSGNLEVHHFDFYRLHEPGVVRDQLQESLQNPRVITVVEWSGIVKDVLPKNRITVEFKPVPDNEAERIIIFEYPNSKMELVEKLRNKMTESES